MAAFRFPVDVGNRALQHCGGTRIDPSLGFTENSRNASEVGFAYDKLREAELRKNYWTFAIRRAILRALSSTTMRLVPAMWSAVTTYFVGSIIADGAGNLWISNSPNNLNNDPMSAPVWEPYFGPLAVPLYDSTQSYVAGELVYTTPGDGTNRVYLSLQSSNSDNPATATAWSATDVYSKNMVVTRSAIAYMSLIDLNTNQDPALAPALWAVGTTYAIGNKVGAADGMIYQSSTNGNVGNNPISDGGVRWTNTGVLNPWTTVFTGGTGSDKWLQIGGLEFPAGVTLATMNITYPVGTGPSTQTQTKNVYLLPGNYMRMAPQNPKPGLAALGGPTGVGYDDWLIENGYLISRQTGPLVLRFVANFTDVSRMDVLFCELVAAQIAFAVCGTLAQDKGQIQIIAKVLQQKKFEAATSNAIENGYQDPPDDDYLTVRY